MLGKERREKILETLYDSNTPITGSQLATMYGVSRQVIVQDVALIRAAGYTIVSTADGYLIYKIKENTHKRVFCVNHTNDQLEEELLIIIDNGGHVLNIIVDHILYGEISVDLHLASRRQVKAFVERTSEGDFVPLMSLTKGDHYHTIEADSEEILDDIEKELDEKGFLIQIV